MSTKVMIAEDDMSTFSCYQNFLSKDENIEIVAHAKDGETTLKMYQEIKPDILLLDLNLPKMNGLEIINNLSHYDSVKCNIVVVSGDLHLRQNLLNTKRIYKIIPKPADFEIIRNTIQEMKSEQIISSFPEQECQTLLMRLKLNPYSRSCRLLIDIIKLCYIDSDRLDNMRNIYHIMSLKYSCSEEKIKSRLRSCIRTVNRFSPVSTLSSIFFINNDDFNNVVSIKQFFNGIIVYLKNSKDFF